MRSVGSIKIQNIVSVTLLAHPHPSVHIREGNHRLTGFSAVNNLQKQPCINPTPTPFSCQTGKKVVYTVNMQSGILVINKRAGMSSHHVVDVVRKITGERTVGHAGTLDPFATGVLVVGVGRAATKVLGAISKETEKQYTATARLGATSDTDDRDGRIVEMDDVAPRKKSDVEKALMTFVGTIAQVPPAYSAKKVGGVKAYDAARKGTALALAPRDVTVHSIDLIQFAWPYFTFEVMCSSGTYIRAIARDLGNTLGVGAYLDALERTAVGLYSLKQAHTIEELVGEWAKFLLPIPGNAILPAHGAFGNRKPARES